MERLLAKQSIVEAIFSIARALDDLDTGLFVDQFLPNDIITLDVSGHIQAMAPQEISPTELAQQMCHVLAGFAATHHVLTNPMVKFDEGTESKATATVYFSAYHCLFDESNELQNVFARGRWEMEVEAYKDGWVIRSLAIKRTVPLSPRELEYYNVSIARVKAGEGRPSKAQVQWEAIVVD